MDVGDGIFPSNMPMVTFSDSDSGSVLLEGSLRVGEVVCLDSPPSEVRILLVREDTSQFFQEVRIDATCSGDGLTVKDMFGSMQLTSYMNEDEDCDCFPSVLFSYGLNNTGSTPLQAQGFNRTLNGSVNDLPTGPEIAPNGKIIISEAFRLAACDDISYTNVAVAEALATDGTQPTCSDTDTYSFSVMGG